MKPSNLLPDLTPVKSSSIEASGHDGHSLWLRFKNRTLYQYPGCPAEHHEALCKADSPGRHFAAKIRGHYTGHKVG